MDAKSIVEDIRRQFGARRGVLYPHELGDLLGSESALAEKVASGKGIPFPVKRVRGKVCVSVHDVAEWLTSDARPNTRHDSPVSTAGVGYPKNSRRSLARAMLALQDQQRFLDELVTSLARFTA